MLRNGGEDRENRVQSGGKSRGSAWEDPSSRRAAPATPRGSRVRAIPLEPRALAREESRPVSRVLSWAIIPLGPTSPWASSGLPGSARRSGAAVLPPRLPYLALLQVGFAEPSGVTTDAVRSYRTVSPLPAPFPALRRFTFCCTFRGLTPPRRYLAPRPAEPGLSSTPRLAPRRKP